MKWWYLAHLHGDCHLSPPRCQHPECFQSPPRGILGVPLPPAALRAPPGPCSCRVLSGPCRPLSLVPSPAPEPPVAPAALSLEATSWPPIPAPPLRLTALDQGSLARGCCCVGDVLAAVERGLHRCQSERVATVTSKLHPEPRGLGSPCCESAHPPHRLLPAAALESSFLRGCRKQDQKSSDCCCQAPPSREGAAEAWRGGARRDPSQHREAEAGGLLGAPGQPGLHGESEAGRTVDYIARPRVNKTKKNQNT